jgi:hypothetical protein
MDYFEDERDEISPRNRDSAWIIVAVFGLCSVAAFVMWVWDVVTS